ncbi:neuronal PAS domain-containing protein 3-like isoform X4 [Ptychodera flava]|uniref:neuronal PAS domain-containing protein 3-like isoform X4 n=1 Tax=Ptychodera flava TaxID=63121 RepID=UPI00396A7CE0
MSSVQFCEFGKSDTVSIYWGNNSQTDTTAPPERNARIIAIRKEKSRDAARSRRGKENYEFYELAKMLPLPGAITSQLDKASIIRLTISYLRMRDFATQGDPPWNVIREIPPNTSVLQKDFKMPRRRSASVIATEVFEHHLGSHLLQSLDGFLFALTSDGRFLYVSETVSIYLGLSQVELTGSSVFDYVHPADHAELAEQLGMKLPPKTSGSSAEGGSGSGSSAASTPTVSSPHTPQQGMTMTMSADHRYERGFFLRMKSTLTKRGVHIKSSGYKVVQISGRLRPRMILTHTQRQPVTIIGFVALAHSLPSPNINEIRMECEMFVSKANLDMKISFCEPRINHYMDLTPSDVLGKSVYDFLHAEDVAEMRTSHFDLLNKGQVVTKYFRWMTKSGGYIWIQTSATITSTKNTNERLVVCINYILSQVEYKNCVMDISQLPNRPTDETSESSNTSESEADSSSDSDEEADPKESSHNSDDSENRDHGSKRRNHSTQNKHTSKKGKKRAKGPGGKGAKKQKYEQRQHRDIGDTKVITAVKQHVLVNSEEPKVNDVAEEMEEKVSKGTQQSERTDVISEDSIKRRGRPRKRKVIQHVNSCNSRESSTGAGSSDVAPHIEGAKTSPPITNDQNPCIPSPQFDNGIGVKSERQETDFQLESWDNPPNREITREQATLLDTPDSPFTRNQSLHRNINQSPVSQSPMSIHDIPKSPFQKTSSISSPSTGVPESVLTPPATETTKSGFVLPPVSSLTPSVINITHNDSHHPLNPPTSLSPMETSKDNQPSSETVTSISAIASAHASLLANLTPQAAKESVINIHPHVLTTDSVTTAYAGMPYASYDKYTYSPYGTAMNLATHAAAYQGNHYSHVSPYGNYTQSQETPMDLTYGSGYGSHMQIVRPEILQNVAKQQYLGGAKSPYAAFADAHDQLSKLHSKSNADVSGGGQQKV